MGWQLHLLKRVEPPVPVLPFPMIGMTRGKGIKAPLVQLLGIPVISVPCSNLAAFILGGMSRQQSRKITHLIGQLIAVGGAPYNLVEGEPFKQLIQAVAPQYIAPSCATFSRNLVPSLYKSCVQALKEELGRAACQSVHFTSDLWSAPSCQHAFLSLTTHWWKPTVSEPMKPKPGARSTGNKAVIVKQGHRSFLLHTQVVDEQHSAQNILHALQRNGDGEAWRPSRHAAKVRVCGNRWSSKYD